MRFFKGSDEAFIAEMNKRKEALVKSLQGAQEHVQAWAQSQASWVEGVSDIGAVTVGIASAAAAPFTLGGSLLVGGAAGALTKVSLKGVDAATGDGVYDGNLLGDLGKGFFAGASGVASAQVARVMGGDLAARLGTGLFARGSSFVLSEGAAGVLDGGAVGAFNTLVDGGTLQQALQNGLTGAAIGGFLGPLVGGAMAGTGRAWKAIGFGKGTPSHVPFEASRELSVAQLKKSGVSLSDLGGDVSVRGLSSTDVPYTMRKPDGSVEMGLPVQKDGTVLAADIGQGTAYLKLMAEARQNPKVAADLLDIYRNAAEVRRLQNELSLATTSGEKSQVKEALHEAMQRLQKNAVYARTQASGVRFAQTGDRAGIDEWGFHREREALQHQIDTARMMGTDEAQIRILQGRLDALSDPAKLQRTLLAKRDISTMRMEMQKLGADISADELATIKKYNFDSPGITFNYPNYAAWTRISQGKG
ncbi:MAG: hypothetical protein AAFV29_16555, partial [Myxococcota bacterium]